MAATRAAFANYFLRGLKEVYFSNYKELPSIYGQIFNAFTSEKNFEEMLSLVGFGKAPVEGELETVTLQDPLEGYKAKFTHLKYGLQGQDRAPAMALAA